MFYAGAFQGGCGGGAGGTGGQHVVQQQHPRRSVFPFRDKKRVFNVGLPVFKRKARLRETLRATVERNRVVWPRHETGKLHSDQGGQVEPAPEIFHRMDWNRDDDGRKAV